MNRVGRKHQHPRVRSSSQETASYDQRTDSVTVNLAPTAPGHRTATLAPGVRMRFDESDHPVGIEVQGVTAVPSDWAALGQDGLTGRERVQAFQLALQAALANAKSLHADARVLFRARSWGRAAALAVIGLEESGKALAYYLLLIGRVPTDRVEPLLRLLKHNHRNKQVLALPAGVLADVVRVVAPLVARVKLKSTPSVTELRTVLLGMMPHLQEAVQNLSSLTKLDDEVTGIMRDGELEAVKHRGLYVDWEGHGRLRTPAQVTRKQAAQVLRNLWRALRGFRLFAPIGNLPIEGLAVIRRMIEDPSISGAVVGQPRALP